MKILKISIATLLLLTTVLFAVGCTEEGFPVTVGNTTFESSPETVAVLSPNVADIIDCIGYDAKVSLVSDEVKTKKMEYITKCGSAIDPDIDTIITSQVEVVFADDNISDGVVKKLEEKEIKVVQFHYSNSNDIIKSTYKSVGTILGGKDGGKKGEKAFEKLIETLSTYKEAVSEKHKTDRLLYLSGTSLYTTVVGDSWYNTVLNYSGATVLSNKNTEPVVTLNEVDKAAPDYLIYDGKTFDSIKDKEVLKDAKFFKNGHNVKLNKEYLKLQGTTAVENIRTIIAMIDKNAVDKADEKINPTEATTQSILEEEETTQKVTTTVKKTDTYELQSKYKVKFTDNAIKEMVKGKTNDYIKAMQERLVDLGYLGKEYTTGFFGDLTTQAISKYQQNNKLKETGLVDSKFLEKLFSSKAKHISNNN